MTHPLVVGGLNELGRKSTPTPSAEPSDRGAKGFSRHGHLTAPEGHTPPPRALNLPPSYTERITTMVEENIEQITTNSNNERNED